MTSKPLAVEMRPQHIDDILGQQHLIGPGKIIRKMVDAGRLTSFILYGPPGSGKTSMAQALSNTMGIPFHRFNASIDAKSKLQQYAKQAEKEPIIVLIDEIHRLTRPNQDFLLPYMEEGQFIVIGATTDNPYITVAPAIRSRAQIFQIKPLTAQDIVTGLNRALEGPLKEYDPVIKSDDLTFLARVSNGDLRSAYTALEILVKSAEPNEQNQRVITTEDMEQVTQYKRVGGDKDGDEHYNLISALQKSIRGSDVDASLHYLARLIETGDLPSIVRRLTVTAYEDIGLARPELPGMVAQGVSACLRIGLPESGLILAFLVIEMALSPKSNNAYMAYNRAMDDLNKGYDTTIPNHLKDAHFKGADQLGHTGYKYPHDFDNNWVAQHYLPKELTGKRYFMLYEDASDREQAMRELADAYYQKRLDELKKQ